MSTLTPDVSLHIKTKTNINNGFKTCPLPMTQSGETSLHPSASPTIKNEHLQFLAQTPKYTQKTEREERHLTQVPVPLVTGVLAEKPHEFQVTFEGEDDPRNSQNWSIARKIKNTVLMTLATMFAGIGSSILDGGAIEILKRFNVGPVVGELANTMFVIGFAFGPQIFGPASEVLGRKWPLVIGIFLSSMFAIQVAGAQNLSTIMIGRFLGGVFGAAPYAIGGGYFHDIYDALHVQGAIAFFAIATAGGPALGPVIGASLASTSNWYGWRWTEWFMLCLGLLTTILLVLFMDESFSPVILQRVAKNLRHETKNWAWHSELDTIFVTPEDVIMRYVLRPIKMLFTEPSLAPVAASLPFLSVFIGIFFGGMLIILDMKRYGRKLKQSKREYWPEQRFVPMGTGAVMLPVGLFWFAFTGPAQCASPWPSIIVLGFSMCGMVLIFECGIIYLIDMYRSFANSAIAANTISRSLVGGGFPLFTATMVHNLGWQSTWGMVLLAFISVALAPIPLVFWFFGERIRGMSKFKPEL